MKTITITRSVCNAFVDGEWIAEDDRPMMGIQNFDLYVEIEVGFDTLSGEYEGRVVSARTEGDTIYTAEDNIDQRAAAIEALLGPGYYIISLEMDWVRIAIAQSLENK